MSEPVLVILLAVLAVLLYLGWRFWPLIAGVARKSDDLPRRLWRWNSFLVPFLPKMMEADLAVATAGTFKDGETGEEYTIATWSLRPTLVPDVDYVALARPPLTEDDRPEIKAIGQASTLRSLLQDSVVERMLWGHRTFVYVWPPEVDLDALAARLEPVEAFKAQHGLSDEGLDKPARRRKRGGKGKKRS